MYEETLEFYQKKWRLDGIRKYLDTPSSILFKVLYMGKPAILKIFKIGSDETKSWITLNAYQGIGAVKILEHADSAILMQEVKPAYALVDITKSGDDNAATNIFCDVVKKLHRKNSDAISLSPVLDLAEGFVDIDNSVISSDLLKKAQEIFIDLESTQKRTVVLHGDLHHFNILQDEEDGWLAIDPKGYIGEPEFEIGAYLKNPIGFSQFFLDKQIIEKRVQIIEDKLGYDRDRMVRWAFSLTILSVIWNIEAKQNYSDWLKLAGLLNAFID